MNMRAISVFAAAMVAAAVGAVERTYVGTDGMWSTAANWSPSGVPEAGDTATIPAGELVEVTGAAAAVLPPEGETPAKEAAAPEEPKREFTSDEVPGWMGIAKGMARGILAEARKAGPGGCTGKGT